MKVERKDIEVVAVTFENGYNIQLTEREAMILTFIVGQVGGIHSFREFLSPFYDEMVEKIGDKNYTIFAEKYRPDVDKSMYLKEH